MILSVLTLLLNFFLGHMSFFGSGELHDEIDRLNSEVGAPGVGTRASGCGRSLRPPLEPQAQKAGCFKQLQSIRRSTQAT
jgi:hypothetical protein